jgi:hypothetical protein
MSLAIGTGAGAADMRDINLPDLTEPSFWEGGLCGEQS